MSIIHDMAEKAAHWKPVPSVAIYAEDHAEKLTCRLCGKQYISSGKHDHGFCPACLREMDEENAVLIGGPLDGEKAHDKS